MGNNKGIAFVIPVLLLRISLAGLCLRLCDWQWLGYLLLQAGMTHLGFL